MFVQRRTPLNKERKDEAPRRKSLPGGSEGIA
jgi:hypothetical protein